MSIRLRLVLWYGALFALVLVIVMLLSYAFHARGHYDDIDRVLVTSAHHAAAEAALIREGPHLVEQQGGLDVVLRLYGPDGRLQETSTVAPGVPLVEPRTVLSTSTVPAYDWVAGLVPPLVMPAMDQTEGAFVLVVTPQERWRGYVLPLHDQRGIQGYVEALTSLGGLDASIAAYRLMLLAVGLAGLGAALAASSAVAGRALRPISQMVETAHAITSSRDLSQRIAAPPSQDELGHLGQTFNEMLASLDEASRTQQRFVADASHELRAPLTVIQGNLELVRRHLNMSPEERGKALAEAERETLRLTRLVTDLLALARADAGVAIECQPVDLDTIVLDAFRSAKQLVRGQVFTLASLEPVQVAGDADRLSQLVFILLDNALKYTPPDGNVTLDLRRTADQAEIVVQDTGKGIAEADLPHVFERFYRADPGRGRDPGGTGLGLPIARWIVEQHVGTIELRSEPGAGTRAVVHLPASPAAATLD